MRGKNFMTLLKNAKNGQNAHHSIESTLLRQSPTVKSTLSPMYMTEWRLLDVNRRILTLSSVSELLSTYIYLMCARLCYSR